MENLNRIIATKLKKLSTSKREFRDIFDISFDQGDRIFSEITDGYTVKKTSYKDAKNTALKMGVYLRKNLNDIKTGEYVGLLMENSLLWVVTFWAILMSGHKVVLLNRRLGAKLNQQVIQNLNVKKILTDQEYNFSEFEQIINLDVIKDINISGSENFNWENEIALSTSATSLNLKICIYDGESISSQISNTKTIVKTNPMIKKHYKGKLKILAFLPFYHIFGLVATYFWFSFFGRTFVFLKDYATDTLLRTIRKHEVTHVFGVPMLWHGIHKEVTRQVNSMDEKTKKKFAKGMKLSLTLQNIAPNLGKKIVSFLFKEVQSKVFGKSIQFMITGGSYISPEALKLINGIGYPLYNGYGMSEIGITSVELRKKIKYRNLGTIGKPFDSVEYRLDDEGCLLVKGQSLCKKIIMKDKVIDNIKDNWFNTTDVMVKDKNNYYTIKGRKDDVVISSNGEKINPDLIEKEIFIPSANRICVLGLKQNNQEALSLIVEINPNSNKLENKKVLDEINENLLMLKKDNYEVEKVYFTTNAIASETAIKVSRNILQKWIDEKQVILRNIEDLEIILFEESDEALKEIIAIVKSHMARILNLEVSKINDNSHFIFDLGGTSLDYISLLIDLKKEFNIEFESSCYNPKDFAKFIFSKY